MSDVRDAHAGEQVEIRAARRRPNRRAAPRASRRARAAPATSGRRGGRKSAARSSLTARPRAAARPARPRSDAERRLLSARPGERRALHAADRAEPCDAAVAERRRERRGVAARDARRTRSRPPAAGPGASSSVADRMDAERAPADGEAERRRDSAEDDARARRRRGAAVPASCSAASQATRTRGPLLDRRAVRAAGGAHRLERRDERAGELAGRHGAALLDVDGVRRQASALLVERRVPRDRRRDVGGVASASRPTAATLVRGPWRARAARARAARARRAPRRRRVSDDDVGAREQRRPRPLVSPPGQYGGDDGRRQLGSARRRARRRTPAPDCGSSRPDLTTTTAPARQPRAIAGQRQRRDVAREHVQDDRGPGGRRPSAAPWPSSRSTSVDHGRRRARSAASGSDGVDHRGREAGCLRERRGERRVRAPAARGGGERLGRARIGSARGGAAASAASSARRARRAWRRRVTRRPSSASSSPQPRGGAPATRPSELDAVVADAAAEVLGQDGRHGAGVGEVVMAEQARLARRDRRERVGVEDARAEPRRRRPAGAARGSARRKRSSSTLS